jgi:hypothetical protein
VARTTGYHHLIERASRPEAMAMDLEEQEKLVSAADETYTVAQFPISRQRANRKFLFSILGLTVVTLGFLLLGFYMMRDTVSTNPNGDVVIDCGRSPTEARERGCHFEPMMSAWVHPSCYFSKVAELYDDIFTLWTWYSDKKQTHLLSRPEELDVLRAGNYSYVFTSASSAHEVHCLYAWRKLNYALEHNHTWIDKRTLEYQHSDHCAGTLTDYVTLRDEVSPVSILRGQHDAHAPDTTDKVSFDSTVWPMLFHPCVPLQHFPR